MDNKQVSAQLQAPQLDDTVKLLKSIDSKLNFFQIVLVLYIIVSIAGAILGWLLA